MLTSIIAICDIFSFYPLRTQIGLRTHAPINLRPSITQDQFDGLVWLRNQTTSTDIVVVHIQLWSYATYLLREIHLTSYARSAPYYGEPTRSYWEQAYNLVLGSPKAFKFFESRWERALIVLTKNYDGQTDAAIKQLRKDWRYKLVVENSGLAMFEANLKTDLQALPSFTTMDRWYTDCKHDNFKVEYNTELGTPVLIWNVNGSVTQWRTINFLPPDPLDLSNHTKIVLAINSSESGHVMEFRLGSDNPWANQVGWRFNIDFIGWSFMEPNSDSITQDLVAGAFDLTDVRLITLGFALRSPQPSNIEFHIVIIVV